MSNFFSSLFGGSSSELNSLISQYGQVGSNSVGQGTKYLNQAGDFASGIVSGDSSKVSTLLAPEIGAAKKSAQEQTKTNATFGTRSGGNTAKNAAENDKVHSDITGLIGSLTGSSVSELGSLGSNLLSTGLGALGQEQGAVQQRMDNWSKSILGKSITGAVSAAESAGIGAGVGALPGGVGAGAGASAALFGSGGGGGGYGDYESYGAK